MTKKSPVTHNFMFGDGCERKPLMAMVEITNSCNMQCPICFSAASKEDVHNSFGEVKEKIDILKDTAGIIPLQISGGEPTLHKELPEIISYACNLGFTNIELVTNGITISRDQDFLDHLVKRGLTAVYLQFDGLKKETYKKLRGQDMSKVRKEAITAARKADICCTLAVAVTRGVNDHEIGDIVQFAIDNIDTVRAINFQSAARFNGRFTVDTEEGFTLQELISLIEKQCNIKDGGFNTSLLGHPECNAMSLVFVQGQNLEPLFSHISQQTLDNFTGKREREILLDLFMGKEAFTKKYFFNTRAWKVLLEASKVFGSPPELSSIMHSKHLLLFAKSFMERDGINGDRIHQCNYGLVDKDGVYSFCAYNNFFRFKNKDQL